MGYNLIIQMVLEVLIRMILGKNYSVEEHYDFNTVLGFSYLSFWAELGIFDSYNGNAGVYQ